MAGESWGTLARRTGLFDMVQPLYARHQIMRWKQAGCPVPAPSAVKRGVLIEYAKKFALRTLVETGTYKADTVRALRHEFDSIHSIEIDAALYEAASARCRNQQNAHLHLGDSAVLIGQIVSTLQTPALFWLDAHYSGTGTGGEGGQPIVPEVQQILEMQAGHVLLIDDVREFGTVVEYPDLEAIADLAAASGHDFEVRDDIARVTPVFA